MNVMVPTFGAGVMLKGLNSWGSPSGGQGFQARFAYTLQPGDLIGGTVSAWSLVPTYKGPGTVVGAWAEFGAPVSVGAGGVLSTENASHQIPLEAGDTIGFTLRVADAGFDPGHFAFAFADLDAPGSAASTTAVASSTVAERVIRPGGDNAVQTGDGDDVIRTGAGNDRIQAGGGHNTIHAGGGRNEVQTGDGDDVIRTGNGDDKILAGGGENRIAAGNGRNEVQTGDGDDVIRTGNGDDKILAGGGDNRIAAGNGRNEVQTGDGDDLIRAGSGDDRIFAGAGNDRVAAGGGRNEVHTGSGHDTVSLVWSQMHRGANQLFGGEGTDTVELVLNAAQAQHASVVADIAGLKAAVEGDAPAYTFRSSATTARDFERIDIVAPVKAVDDKATTDEDRPAAIDVLANDLDLLGDVGTLSHSNDRLEVTSFAVDGMRNGAAVTLHEDGRTLSFDPGGAYQDLAAGESESFAVVYTVQDDQGFSDEATLTVTVTGENDAPVIRTHRKALELPEGDDALKGRGFFTVTDVDASDEVAMSVAEVTATGTGSDRFDPTALLALFTVSPETVDADVGALRNVEWSFAAPAGTFDYLAEGETITFRMTARADDGRLSDTATVSVTVVGTNDAPVVAPGGEGAALVEDELAPVSGTRTVTDENGNVLTLTVGAATVAATDAEGAELMLPDEVRDALVAAIDTTTTVDGNFATIDWTVDLSEEAIDFLAAGDVATVRLPVTATDQSGLSSPADVVITVTGANDAPVVPGDLSLKAHEDDDPFEVDLLTGVTDPDRTSALAVENVTDVGGTGGFSFDGTTFTVDPRHFDDLADGEFATLEVSFDVVDGDGGRVSRTLEVLIEGADESPSLSVEASAGASPNIVVLTVTVEPAGDGRVALTFEGLPDGAALSPPQDELEDVSGTFDITLTLPETADVDTPFKIIATGYDDENVPTLPTEVELDLAYDYTLIADGEAITATGSASIWGGGPQTLHVEQYLPIFGGGADPFRLIEATLVSGGGTIAVEGNEVIWKPGDDVPTLTVGQTHEVKLSYRLMNDRNGEVTEVEDTIKLTGGNLRVEYTVPNGKWDAAAGEVTLDPIRLADRLNEPFVLPRTNLIDFDFEFGKDEFVDIAFDFLKDALDSANAALAAAQTARDAAQDNADEAANHLALATRVVTAKAQEDLARIVVDVVGGVGATGDALLELLRDALNLADKAYKAALDFQNFLQFEVDYAREKAAQNSDLLAKIYYAGVLPIREAALEAAKIATGIAGDALSEARNALEAVEQLGATTIEDAREALNAATAAKNAAFAAYEAAGYEAELDQIDPLYVARRSAESLGALATLGEKEGALLIQQGLQAAAQLAYDTAVTAVPEFSVDADVEINASLEAQVGLNLDLKLNGGTVDAAVPYTLTAHAAYNALTDVLEIAPLAQNADGTVAPYETISPSAQLDLDFLYDLKVGFDGHLDFAAEIAGTTLFDTSPDGGNGLTFDLDFDFEGLKDIIDFDTATNQLPEIDIAGIGFFQIHNPSLPTTGAAGAYDPNFYKEGDLVSLDLNQLWETLVNFVNPGPRLGDELAKFLDDRQLLPAVDPDWTPEEVLAELPKAALLAILNVREFFTAADTNGDSRVPILQWDITEGGAGALVEANLIPDRDDIPEEGGEFGFYTSFGERDILSIKGDLDQAVFTAVNLALGNPIVINPVDFSFGLAEALTLVDVSNIITTVVTQFVDASIRGSIADIKVDNEIGFNQSFALSIDDMAYQVVMEDNTVFEFDAGSGDTSFHIENASQYDSNGDGQISYTLSLTPDANFFNDTELDLFHGVNLDFLTLSKKVKTILDAPVLAISDAIGDALQNVIGDLIDFDFKFGDVQYQLDLGKLAFDLKNYEVGPVIRIEGGVNTASADVFEDYFDLALRIPEFEGAVGFAEDGIA